MTTGTAVSVDEYLHTDFVPRREYVDGVLVPKAMPTRQHSKLQLRLAALIEEACPQYESMPELTLRITGQHYRVPDVVVDRRDNAQDPYPLTPVHLCIEIVSPEDRRSELLDKCKIYHAWGVPYTWILDPQTRQAWQYTRGLQAAEISQDGALMAGDIHLNLRDIFAGL